MPQPIEHKTDTVGDLLTKLKKQNQRLPVLISGQGHDGGYGFFESPELDAASMAPITGGFWFAPSPRLGTTLTQTLRLRNTATEHGLPTRVADLTSSLETHAANLPLLVSTTFEGYPEFSSNLTVSCERVSHMGLSRWCVDPDSRTFAVLISAEQG